MNLKKLNQFLQVYVKKHDEVDGADVVEAAVEKVEFDYAVVQLVLRTKTM